MRWEYRLEEYDGFVRKTTAKRCAYYFWQVHYLCMCEREREIDREREGERRREGGGETEKE